MSIAISSRPRIAVPFVDLSVSDPALKEALLEATDRVLSSGQFILGEEVEHLEEEFAAYIGTHFAIGVGNGTDALTLTLQALGIGSGDEVITVPNSFVATASSIVLAGATSVFVDVREDFTMDPARLASAITARTKAIIPVHLTGQPADMDAVLAIANRCSIPVIEDASQAAGARVGKRRVGSLGIGGCFSLHPLKSFSAYGDGGLITTNDAKLRERLQRARNHGLKNRDECMFWSKNSRLDALQASFLRIKLPFLEHWNEARRSHARFYQHQLAGVVDIPSEHPGMTSVYHTFVIQTPHRDGLKAFLAERGIETAIHYPIPIHLQPAAVCLGYERGDFPVTERQAEHILSLPIYPGLTDELRAYVADCVKEFFTRRV